MGGKKLTSKTVKRKGGPLHPGSRRAAQLARVTHREGKLSNDKKVRKKGMGEKADRLATQVLLLPPDWSCVPDLSSLHSFIQSSYLPRYDVELRDLSRSRVAHGGGTRPPSKRELDLKQLVEKERRLYEDGNLELLDLLSEKNVRIAREWNGDVGGLTALRLVRVSGKDQSQYIVTQEGRHRDLKDENAAAEGADRGTIPDTKHDALAPTITNHKASVAGDAEMQVDSSATVTGFRQGDSMLNMDG